MMATGSHLPSPLRGGPTRPKAERGGGRGARARSWRRGAPYQPPGLGADRRAPAIRPPPLPLPARGRGYALPPGRVREPGRARLAGACLGGLCGPALVSRRRSFRLSVRRGRERARVGARRQGVVAPAVPGSAQPCDAAAPRPRRPRDDGAAARPGRPSRPRLAHRRGLRHRASRLERGLARRSLRRAGAAPGRHGLRRGARRARLPDAALPRARGAGLVPRRRLRRRLDRASSSR